MKIAKPVSQSVAVLLCAFLAVAPLLAGEQEKFPARRWKLKYQAGSGPFLTNQPVNVLMGKEAILLFGGTDREQSIPVEDVTQITYDTARGRYASRALAGTIGDMRSGADLVMYMYFMLPMAIVALPFKGTRHFVTIEWTEGHRHRAVMLRMKGSMAKDFIAELEHATGATARNLDREREEFKQAQKLKARQKEPTQETPAPEK